VPTIGVALPVPEPWGAQLQAYRTSLGDAAAAQIPSHITLLPPVEVAHPDLEKVADHLADAAASQSAFRVHLRGTGTFRPVSPVVFVALADGVTSCAQLATAIRQGPLGVELAFPYHPHVTIAQHLPDHALDRAYTDLSDFGCDFEAGSFHLYAHDQDSGWNPTQEFPLGPATG
jgi:2'-5' RNA ligase